MENGGETDMQRRDDDDSTMSEYKYKRALFERKR